MQSFLNLGISLLFWNKIYPNGFEVCASFTILEMSKLLPCSFVIFVSKNGLLGRTLPYVLLLLSDTLYFALRCYRITREIPGNPRILPVPSRAIPSSTSKLSGKYEINTKVARVDTMKKKSRKFNTLAFAYSLWVWKSHE